MRIEIEIIKEEKTIKVFKDNENITSIPIQEDNLKNLKKKTNEDFNKLINNFLNS
jgi:hypothetical protein